MRIKSNIQLVFILLCCFQTIVISQVAPVPPDILKCIESDTCSCLNERINSNSTSIDSKAHAFYYSVFWDCSPTIEDSLTNLKKAINLWNSFDYRKHRKHYAYSFIMSHFYQNDFSIDSLKYYFNLAKSAPTKADANAAYNLAECYNIMGDAYGRVNDYYRQVKVFSDLLNSSLYQELADSVKALNLYYAIEGTLSFPKNDYNDNIRNWIDQSYILFDNHPFKSLVSNNDYLSLIKYNEGRLFVNLNEFEKAIDIFSESRDFARIIDYVEFEAIATTAIAEVAFQAKNNELSLQAAVDAIDVYSRSQSYFYQSCEPYYWLVKNLRKTRSFENIEETILNGINLSFDTDSIQLNSLVDLNITQSKNGEFTLRLMMELADYYYEKYTFSSERRFLEEANKIYESCFLQFHDFVSQQDNLNSRYLNKDLQIELFERLVKIASLSRNSNQLFSVIDKNKMSIMKHSNFNIQTRFDDLGVDCSIIQYAFTSDSLLAVVYDDDVFSTYRLGESKGVLDLINKYNIQLNDIDDEIYMTSHSLYQRLIEPLSLKCKKIIIIPDNELFKIPFGALNQRSENIGSFMEKEFDIHYQYSAALIREETKLRNENKRTVSIFVPEFLEEPDRIYATLRGTGIDMELFHLPYAKTEGDYIKNTLGGNISKVSKDAISNAVNNNGIVHYAGHAVTLPDNPDYSFLALSSDIADENNKLYMKDLLDLQCNNDMVVLSACETGTGKIAKGEGALSLARGFFFAGAKSVISTLWSVNDKSSSMIMKSFYLNLKVGKSKDVALREAKLTYLSEMKDPTYRHPYYWAGFIPVGDMSPLQENLGNKRLIYLGGILISLLVGFLLLGNRLFQATH